MKKIIALACFMLACTTCFAQLQFGYHYRIKTNQVIYYKIDGIEQIKKIAPPKKALKANLKPDDKIPGKINIEFWGFSKDNYAGDYQYVNSQDSSNAFYLKIIPRTLLTVATPKIIPYTTWELGVTTIPLKFRFGYKKDAGAEIPNDVSTSINAGLYVGKKWGGTRFNSDKTTSNTLAFTASAFAGPCIVAVSGDNTDPKATIKSNELAVSTGLAFQLSKGDFNIGFLIGKDLTTSQAAKSWYYANKTWIGFGLGYKLAILNGGK